MYNIFFSCIIVLIDFRNTERSDDEEPDFPLSPDLTFFCRRFLRMTLILAGKTSFPSHGRLVTETHRVNDIYPFQGKRIRFEPATRPFELCFSARSYPPPPPVTPPPVKLQPPRNRQESNPMRPELLAPSYLHAGKKITNICEPNVIIVITPPPPPPKKKSY